jgi:hypothetical protein
MGPTDRVSDAIKTRDGHASKIVGRLPYKTKFQVVFHFYKHWGHNPLKKNEVLIHFQTY